MILADFTCPEHGRFEAFAPSDAESCPCPELLPPWEDHGPAGDLGDGGICQADSPWSPSPVRGRVRTAEVERGGVDKPASPMYLDTRELGEGMPMEEWRAKRDKMYEERRHKEAKEVV
jgi:hypothetical protein